MADSYTLFVIMDCIAGIGLAVSAGFVAARMSRNGGSAGLCLTLFILMLLAWVICVGVDPVLPPELALVVGVLSLVMGGLGWFFIFLSSEYSTSEKPNPLHVFFVAGGLGAVFFGLISGLTGSGTLYLTSVAGFGWILNMSFLQMIAVFLFITLTFLYFLRFCYRAHRAARYAFLRQNMKILFTGIATGMFGILFSWTIGILNPDLVVFSSMGMVSITGFATIIGLFAIVREPRVVFFLIHDAIALFVLDAETGLVRYYRSLVEEDEQDVVQGSDILGGALTAVNNLIRESLRLNETSWVREFSTQERTFILDARPNGNLVGVLLVSKPTQLLKIALRRFVDAFLAAGDRFNPQRGITEEAEMEQERLIRSSFPFLVIPERKKRPKQSQSKTRNGNSVLS